MNTANFKNGNKKYPLSTDTLEFMQQQIHLAYGLANLYGSNYIITQSSADADGLIVIGGELMPLRGDANTGISIVENSIDVEAAGQTFEAARIERYAKYCKWTRVASRVIRRADNFPIIDGIANHLVPKGVINMWSGSVDDIPLGWQLCDGTDGTPDLRGRFIVGYSDTDSDYGTIGATGGEKLHTLTIDEMPLHNHGGKTGTESAKHNHGFNMTIRSNSSRGTTGSESLYSTFTKGDNLTINNNTTDHTHTITAQGANQPHENRPPYYVLAYIMKTI